MVAERAPLHLQVQTLHADTGVPLTDVSVEAVVLDCEIERIVARAHTSDQGIAWLDLPHDAWRHQLLVRLSDEPAEGVVVARDTLDGAVPTLLHVAPASELAQDHLALLADQLVATRRVRAEDFATDLAEPSPDSVVRMLSAGVRARFLVELSQLFDRDEDRLHAGPLLIDPVALRDGNVQLIPIRELTRPGFDPTVAIDIDAFTRPGIGWELFPWARSDDESYRDYLRSVFVLFAHQQKLGAAADGKTFKSVVESQLSNRFFQNFSTPDRAVVPLNRLLVPIIRAILTAADGSGFGFKIPTATLPVQGTRTDRQYLDALLALAPVKVQEFANRYRLPLNEPDSATSSPLKLNIYTLSRILSDTAQGPVEPPGNVIEPPLPGVEGKPILWSEVIGSAPFFLRFDEWLARQQPFFAENLFAIRTQVAGAATGPWLSDACKRFLEEHQKLPGPVKSYQGYFATTSEVERSATFLLAYGAADLKLTELIHAIDKNQFAAAARLAGEAELLLWRAHPKINPGETWEPDVGVGNFPPALSLRRRSKLKVSNITELTGTPGSFPPTGFERFFELPRPVDWWQDLVPFRNARDMATRLRMYQLHFLLPMLRATIQAGLGDLPGTVELLGSVTGFYVGIGMVGTPAGMVKHPEAAVMHTRVVAGRLRWNLPLGDRPYTARLMYDGERRLDGPFTLTPQIVSPGYDVLKASPTLLLHPLEERFARIAQADAMLAWAEALYRTDDASSLERARELYKAVIFLHGEDPGTSAYLPRQYPMGWSKLTDNPRIRNQIDRARLALYQLEAGLNFYGYSDDAVPTLRYDTLVSAAQRWAVGAKSAQTDYLAYLGRVEQLDLDLLAAKAQEQKARATVSISTEQIEIAKAGVAVAKQVVTQVERLIAAKRAEIEDSNSLFTQFSDYFSGMKSSISSMVDVGKGASEGWTSLSSSGAGEALGLGGQGAGGGAAAGTPSTGLGSAMGGLSVVGGFAAFAVLSTMTLQGMADAATRRQGELMALTNEALPAAQAGVRVQERNVTIANLQAQIAITDLAYARDLINFQNERFLNRDFWEALAGVARRSLHRYLDLAGQGAWFAERALAYRLAIPIRIIQIGYFDARMRNVGGVDRLALDLAELEALRLAAARVTVPLTVTYSLARDLPLVFGQLKANGICDFTLSDEALMTAHPGTFAHRIRAVDVQVDTPGTVVPARGMLTNGGFSLLRREATGARVPLLRFADAYPVSEFRLRSDMALHGLPGEHLLPFEGAGFTSSWTLELPKAANPMGLNRITDVRITFDLQAAYELLPVAAALPLQPASRAVFVSALAIDASGLSRLRTATEPAGNINFSLDRLALPTNAAITNLAVLLPGVEGGTFQATISFGESAPTAFDIGNGLAMSNLGVFSDGNPINVQPLNAAAVGSPARPATLTVVKGDDAARLTEARDVLLWLEYTVP